MLIVFAAFSWALVPSPEARETSSKAGETIEEFEIMPGRTYHAFLYEESDEESRCVSCHGEGPIPGYPPDDGCADCHSIEDLAKATARPTEERWQNPHDNMHFGMTMPCVECHGEHSVKEVYCARCHEFNYPNHKD